MLAGHVAAAESLCARGDRWRPTAPSGRHACAANAAPDGTRAEIAAEIAGHPRRAGQLDGTGWPGRTHAVGALSARANRLSREGRRGAGPIRRAGSGWPLPAEKWRASAIFHAGEKCSTKPELPEQRLSPVPVQWDPELPLPAGTSVTGSSHKDRTPESSSIFGTYRTSSLRAQSALMPTYRVRLRHAGSCTSRPPAPTTGRGRPFRRIGINQPRPLGSPGGATADQRGTAGGDRSWKPSLAARPAAATAASACPC